MYFSFYLKAAISHQGYSLVDILQPCVSFNKVNTYAYYSQRVYELGEEYDYTNKLEAIAKSMEGGGKIPIGILYQEKRLEQKENIPIIDRPFDMDAINHLIQRFI